MGIYSVVKGASAGRRWLVATLALVTVGLSLGAGSVANWITADASPALTTAPQVYGLDAEGYSAFDWIGRIPLERQIELSEIIVVARVVKIGDPYEILLPGVNPELIERNGGVAPSDTFTNVTFKVEEYLKGSGPAEFVTPHPGDLSKGGYIEFPRPLSDRDIVLFLVPAPDSYYGEGLWLSRQGPWGQMFEEDGRMRFAWNGEEPSFDVPELAGRDFEASKVAVRDAVRGVALTR